MTEFTGPGRARRAEAEYFRRRDQELVDRACAVRCRQHDEGELAAALGTADPETVRPLYDWGMRAASVAVVDCLPSLEIAWLDGLDDGERELLRQRLAAHPAASPAAVRLFEEWLAHRPSHGLFAAGGMLGFGALSADERAYIEFIRRDLERPLSPRPGAPTATADVAGED